MIKLVILVMYTLVSVSTLNAIDNTIDDARNDSVRASINAFAKLEDKEVSEVNKIKKMFKKGKASGQLKLMYSEVAESGNAFATAIGGVIKYELAEYHGFNAGAAVYTSYDIPFTSGEGDKRNTEMSSDVGNYTDMSEAFVNYKYDKLNFRAGRQVLDTPLADSDNIRMIQNTFEAYVLTYDISGFELMVGNLQKWHGTDAGLEFGWVETGTEGSNFAGLSYFDGLELEVWYYNITNLAQVAYFDVGIEYNISETFLLHTMIQYLQEDELGSSGISASIYGALVELVVYDIALDRDSLSYVLGVVYSYDDFEFLYAYGDFSGESNSSGDKEHIVEQNIRFGYNFNEEFIVGALYAVQEDKIDSSSSWNRFQTTLNYNF